MCGICGFYEFENNKTADVRILRAMLQVLEHRGPDDSGTYSDRNLAMGMRRLSIIDLDGGKQPICNEDASIVTVFNGEIYNYKFLRSFLERRGHALRTASDTEVIVHLFEEFGDDCVEHLRGMFGLAVWDTRQRRLFIARDRLGIKPLYFAEVNGLLVFASEIKALLQHPAMEVQMNVEALSNFLSLKYVPAPQTIFKNIQALPPGWSLSCGRNGVTVKRYWDVSFAKRVDSAPCEEAAYAEQLESLLRECVKMHLVSDVPFGAFLSGGIDSSTIVALMSQFLQKPVKTYSVGFDGYGEAYSELPYARLVAREFRTDHHEVIIEPSHAVDLAEKVAWHLDQPLAEHATLANYMVAELASRDVKMVLTGEGGDELFAGYARHAGERWSSLFRAVPKAARSIAIAASSAIPGLRRPKIALNALSQANEVKRLFNWFPLFNAQMKQELLCDDLKEALNGHESEDVFAEALRRTDAAHSLERLLYIDTKLWLPDLLLARGDKMSMAVSLEARVPLLDHKLVEFAASLPPGLKVRGLARKYLLKQVSKKWLPREIINRKKKGFPMPSSVWLRKEARAFMRDMLCPLVLRRRGLFNPVFVEKLMSEHEQGFADHGSLLWGLISVELWQRVFMDSCVRSTRSVEAFAASRG